MPWLAWLLPLLGLAAGWAIWSKYKSMFDELQGTVSGLNSRIKSLEGELSGCKSHSATLEGDLALAKGKLREAEEAQLAASKLAGGSTARTSGSVSTSGSSGTTGASGSSSTGSSGGASTSGTSGSVSGSVGSASGSASFSGSESGSGSSGISGAASIAGGASGGGASSEDKYAKLTSDNLQVIEGIGPKMDEVLKANGISSWSDLAASTPDKLRAILDKYGDQYKIIDPTTWPQQAQLAANKKFSDLISLQKNLDTGVDSNTGETPSKIEKIMTKLGIIKAYKQDDLKVVEGIGPKIEELLHAAGIKTWAQLANTEVAKIKAILDAGGSKFQLADPGTWPKQAELLAAGKFDELEAYQEFLQGGK
jgi:predicted flap endonuclease-1-like 5' DNA nuclease